MSDLSVQTIRVVDARPASGAFRVFGKAPAVQLPPCEPHNLDWEGGYLAAKAEAADDRESMLALIASAEALQPEPSEELAALIAETVMRLVTEIVGSVEIGRDALLKRAIRAASMIGDADSARTMWVNPDDLPLLKDCGLGLSIMPDPAAARGSIRIDCSPGWIEHGTPLYLEALRTELGLHEAVV